MTVHAILTATRDLISGPDRWRRLILAADEDGQPVSPLGPAAGYCLAGALQHVTQRTDWMNADGLLGTGRGLAATVIGGIRGMYPQHAAAPDPVGAVNNELGHRAVLALLDALIGQAAPARELVLAV